MSSPITAQSSFTPLNIVISTVIAVAVVVALRVLRNRPVNPVAQPLKLTTPQVALLAPIAVRPQVPNKMIQGSSVSAYTVPVQTLKEKVVTEALASLNPGQRQAQLTLLEVNQDEIKKAAEQRLNGSYVLRITHQYNLREFFIKKNITILILDN